MRVEVIDSLAAFDAIQDEWNDLLARHTAANVFLTHAWLRCAWLFVAGSRRLLVLLVRDGAHDRLVGAVALSLETIRVRGIAVRRLSFLTDPMIACVRSDIILADNGPGAAACVRAIAGWLVAQRRHWDVCVLDSIPADAPCLPELMRSTTHSLAMRAPEKYWVVHRLAIDGNWEAYQAAHGAHLRTHLARERRKLYQLGAPEVQLAFEVQAVADGVETFIAMERLSVKQQRDNYTPLDQRLRQFYRTVLAALALENKALVATLALQGRPAAVILAAHHEGCIHTLNDMYHPDYRNAYAGHYLRGALVEWAWRQPCRILDFNGYGAHLQRWRTEGLPLYRTVLYSPATKGRLLHRGREHWLPWARRTLPSWMLPAQPVTIPGDRGLVPGTS